MPILIGIFAVLLQIPFARYSYWTFADFMVIVVLISVMFHRKQTTEQALKKNILSWLAINNINVKQIGIGCQKILKQGYSPEAVRQFFSNFAAHFTTNSTNINMWVWYAWLFVFTAWMTFSFIIGGEQQGHFSLDVFMTKYLGWWVLVFYFLLGNFLAQRKESLDIFLKTLFISSAMLSTLLVIGNVLYPELYEYIKKTNGFELFYTFIFLIQIPFLAGKKLFSLPSHLFIFIANLSTFSHIGTKSTLLAFIIGIWGFIWHNTLTHYKIKRKYLWFGSLFVGLGVFLLSNLVDFKNIKQEISKTVIYKMKIYPQVRKLRDEINIAAARQREHIATTLNSWRHSPFAGFGLGNSPTPKASEVEAEPVFKIEKLPAASREIDSPHPIQNTLLTLLSEIGMVGVFLYLWFIIKSGRLLFRKKYAGEANELTMAMIMILPAFIAASFTMDIFYQRYIWLLWGMVLVNIKSKEVLFANFQENLDLQINPLNTVKLKKILE